MEQNVDVLGSRRARHATEQNVDIPVPRTRSRDPDTAPQRFVGKNVDLPVHGPRPSRGFRPRQGSQRTVEQIIGFPVSRTRDGGGLLGVHLQQGSTARGGARERC